MTASKWFRRGGGDALSWEIDDEFDAHLALRIQDNIARGMSPEDARAEAERRLGSRALAAAASHRVRGRGQSMRRAFVADLRDAWRTARRAPATALFGLLVAAVGLGAVFGAARLADSLLARAPGGVRQPSTLYSAMDSFDGTHVSLMSRPVFEAVARAAPDATPFAWSGRELQLIHPLGSRVVAADFVTGGYFAALGVRPGAGRLIGQVDVAEERGVAVVSRRLARLIGGDRVLGERLTINGQPFDVVGIAESRFLGLEAGRPVDAWLPVSTEPRLSAPRVFPDGRQVRGYWSTPGIGWLRGGLRLPDGASPAALGQQLTSAVRASLAVDDSNARRVILSPDPWLSPFGGERDRVNAVIAPVGWAVLCTLLLTAACLASLYVGRLSDRQHEIALRLALGAGRWRVVRLACLEIAFVATMGGAVGAVASEGMLAAVASLRIAGDVTIGSAIAPLDARAATLLAVLVLATIGFAAVAPAWLVVRETARAYTAGSARTVASGNRFRRLLMVAQVAAGCALLSAATLLTQSITALRAQPLGFDAASVAFVELDPADAGLDEDRRADVVRRLLASPLGAGSQVAVADELPFRDASTLFAVSDDPGEARVYPFATSRIAGPYFETLGIALVAGRTFTPSDEGRPVTIVSQPLAEIYWPGVNPVGRTLRIGGKDGVPHEVVGVVTGLRDATLRGRPTPRIYLPFDDRAEALSVFARPTVGSPAVLLPALQQLALELDSRLVVIHSGTLQELAVRTIEQRLLIRLLTAGIGLGSLIMVAAGVWGLSHGSLRQRWREFGIRQALGARPWEIGRLALADARFVCVFGGGLGVLGGWQFGRLIESWLFTVEPWDPASLGAAALVVTAASIAGAIWPARRAMAVDAAALLREE
jgi:predicted permease